MVEIKSLATLGTRIFNLRENFQIGRLSILTLVLSNQLFVGKEFVGQFLSHESVKEVLRLRAGPRHLVLEALATVARGEPDIPESGADLPGLTSTLEDVGYEGMSESEGRRAEFIADGGVELGLVDAVQGATKFVLFEVLVAQDGRKELDVDKVLELGDHHSASLLS